MATIPQPLLFSWEEIEELGDLSRLKLLLENLPDEDLMLELESARGNGRDDYPVRAMWNSLLAGIVFQHASIESLRRELSRNGQLRLVCGFDPTRGNKQVPESWVYTRFQASLTQHHELVEA
ncbi:MAG: transposase, partial [Kiritimatiellia bacterium]|nr:transposase [Kiritimatiellia bacterium]